jgi:hypothetical protein
MKGAHSPLPSLAQLKAKGDHGAASLLKLPRCDDYGVACTRGRVMAGELLQRLRDEPRLVGSNVLGGIAHELDKAESGSAMSGYRVGFWSLLEVALLRSAADVVPALLVESVQMRADAVERDRLARMAGSAGVTR